MPIDFRTLFAALRKRARRASSEPDAQFEKRLVLNVKQSRFLPTQAQLAHLPRVLGARERVVFAIALVLFVITSGLLGGALITRYQILIPTSGGTFTEAVVGQPQLINPLWADGSSVDRDLTALIYPRLFRYGADHSLTSELAASSTVSSDRKTYTIKLKPNLVWDDGEALDASDVVFTIETIQNPAFHSPHRNEFSKIHVSAADDSTIVFLLDTPSASFLDTLTIGILPQHLWNNIPPENMRLAEWNIKPVGAGPFLFKTLKKTKSGTLYSYTLEANPKYVGRHPHLASVVFRFFTDTASAVAAVAQGNADGVAFAPHDALETLNRKHHLIFYPLDLAQITGLFFNQKQNSLLADEAVREALARSVNKNTVVHDAFFGSGALVDGPLPAGATYSAITRYPFDQSLAAQLLDTDGWKLVAGKSTRVFVPHNKKDKRFVKDMPLHLTLTTVNVPEYVQAAELVGAAWRSLGIEVRTNAIEPTAIDKEIINPRKYDVLLYGETYGADIDPYPFWHSSQVVAPGVNLAGYSNRRVDALLEEARTLQNPNDRAARYNEFQKIITADLPAIFLLSPTYPYVISDRVRGVVTGRIANPADRFAGIADWYVNTKAVFHFGK